MSKASEEILPLDELQKIFYISLPLFLHVLPNFLLYCTVSEHHGFIAWKACVQWDIS
jgi:hypothetical protein